MRLNKFLRLLSISSFVFIAYTAASAQDTPVVKETADAAKKVRVVVTDGLEKAVVKTKDAALVVGEKGKAATRSFGTNTLVVTENITSEAKGTTPEGGRYYTVTTWDGSRWVSKQVLYPPKKVQ
jgi:hypothetical protein